MTNTDWRTDGSVTLVWRDSFHTSHNITHAKAALHTPSWALVFLCVCEKKFVPIFARLTVI